MVLWWQFSTSSIASSAAFGFRMELGCCILQFISFVEQNTYTHTEWFFNPVSNKSRPFQDSEVSEFDQNVIECTVG